MWVFSGLQKVYRTQDKYLYLHSYCRTVLHIASILAALPSCLGPLTIIVTIKNVPTDFQNSLLGVAPLKNYSNSVLKKPEIFLKASKCSLFIKAYKLNFYIWYFLKVGLYPYVYIRQYLIILNCFVSFIVCYLYQVSKITWSP